MPFTNVPYWRLSGFYFFYFILLGILMPYWSLYLQSTGFSAEQIGELTALLFIARIVSPNIFGWLADRHYHPIQIVRLTSFITIIAIAMIFINQGFWWFALVHLLFSFFWNASLPQVELTTLKSLGENSHHYTKIRVWGSISFIAIVIVLGYLLESHPANIIPISILLSAIGIWAVSLSLPKKIWQPNNQGNISLRTLLNNRSMLAFLLLCFLSQVSHGPYYTFYTIYLENHGYSNSLIGQLWALGVIAEVIIFLFVSRFLTIFGYRAILLFSIFISGIRWLLIAFFVNNLPVLIFAQLLHAFTYGAYHAAAIAWVYQHFSHNTQARGQALYSSISFGVGGAAGSLLSGYLWASPGPTWTFIIAALCCFVAFFTSLVWLREKDTPSRSSSN